MTGVQTCALPIYIGGRIGWELSRLKFEEKCQPLFSENFHWTCWITNACPLLDTCPNPVVSSENFQWTKALLEKKKDHEKKEKEKN